MADGPGPVSATPPSAAAPDVSPPTRAPAPAAPVRTPAPAPAVSGRRPRASPRPDPAASTANSPSFGVRTSASARSEPPVRGRCRVEDRRRAGQPPEPERLVRRTRADLVPDQHDVAFRDREPLQGLPDLERGDHGVGAAGHRDRVLAVGVDDDQGDSGRMAVEAAQARDNRPPPPRGPRGLPRRTRRRRPPPRNRQARRAEPPRPPDCRPCRRGDARTARRSPSRQVRAGGRWRPRGRC